MFVLSGDAYLLLLGALLMGLLGAGMWGVVPTYLSERFPTSTRGVGTGFAFHAGAAMGALAPFVIGSLKDRGWALPHAMAACIIAALLIVTAMVWGGPETRGREFVAVDGA